MNFPGYCLLFAAMTAACFGQAAQSTLPQSAPSPADNTLTVRVVPGHGHSMLPEASPVLGTDLETPEEAWNQTGCPVVLTAASIASKGHYLPVNAIARSESPGLSLKFRNMSGKGIRSAVIKAQLKFKKSIYDLDSTTVAIYLTVHGTDVTDEESNLSRVIPLDIPAFGVGAVSLQRVNYVDGSTWVAKAKNSCGISPTGMLRAAGR